VGRQVFELRFEAGKIASVAVYVGHRSRQVYFGVASVKQSYLVTEGEELVDNARPDESGSADNQDSHLRWERFLAPLRSRVVARE
jgi:hypothetical protein